MSLDFGEDDASSSGIECVSNPCEDKVADVVNSPRIIVTHEDQSRLVLCLVADPFGWPSDVIPVEVQVVHFK
jgi:hypothetical protein